MEVPMTGQLQLTLGNEEQEFTPDCAGEFFWNDDLFHSRTVSDSGFTVTIEAEDSDGDEILLTYSLSQVIVGYAEYDNPSEATYTTEPDSVERLSAYGDSDSDPALLQFDGRSWQPHNETRRLWDEALDIEVREDFMCATGTDHSEPVPQEYDAYWILTRGAYKDSLSEPFFVHENATETETLDQVLQLQARVDSVDDTLSTLEEKLDTETEENKK